MWNSKMFVEEDPLHLQVTKKFKVCPTANGKWPLDDALVHSGTKQAYLISCYSVKRHCENTV